MDVEGEDAVIMATSQFCVKLLFGILKIPWFSDFTCSQEESLAIKLSPSCGCSVDSNLM